MDLVHYINLEPPHFVFAAFILFSFSSHHGNHPSTRQQSKNAVGGEAGRRLLSTSLRGVAVMRT